MKIPHQLFQQGLNVSSQMTPWETLQESLIAVVGQNLSERVTKALVDLARNPRLVALFADRLEARLSRIASMEEASRSMPGEDPLHENTKQSLDGLRFEVRSLCEELIGIHEISLAGESDEDLFFDVDEDDIADPLD